MKKIIEHLVWQRKSSKSRQALLVLTASNRAQRERGNGILKKKNWNLIIDVVSNAEARAFLPSSNEHSALTCDVDSVALCVVWRAHSPFRRGGSYICCHMNRHLQIKKKLDQLLSEFFISNLTDETSCREVFCTWDACRHSAAHLRHVQTDTCPHTCMIQFP